MGGAVDPFGGHATCGAGRKIFHLRPPNCRGEGSLRFSKPEIFCVILFAKLIMKAPSVQIIGNHSATEAVRFSAYDREISCFIDYCTPDLLPLVS